MNIREEARAMKLAAPKLAASSAEQRNAALAAVAAALDAKRDEIFAANHADMDAAAADGVSGAVMKRLKFDTGKLEDVIKGIQQLITLPDPLNQVTLARELDEGLIMQRITVPIGVIGVIFEARPDALVQISTLCIKSGNCAILKGGKETARTNRVLFETIHAAAVEAGLPAECLLQAELHNEIDELLSCEKDVDLLIPRGSNAFVQYIMNNTKIPVMGHADGVCHIYVYKDADESIAIPVLLDAKTQYTAACNAVETILVHRDIAKNFLPKLAEAFRGADIRLRGTEEAGELLSDSADSSIAGTVGGAVVPEGYEIMQEDEFHREYLELIASVRVVSGVEEAVEHINRFGSHHTDAIITANDETAAYFMQMVDSAGVYRNCSTRFADGFRYGFGAEVGISTSKLHARGPVGLEGLVTYKYEITGAGHIVGDYASGRRQFHFRDL
ncbi:MAG: glutamate-5-semialdehyde dehydrogenase [Eubacterium sp.]|nr:glutamate-5-semialdehyde dehydrogenase [Eubacterium sp.]